MKRMMLGLGAGIATIMLNSAVAFAAPASEIYDVELNEINVIVETQEVCDMEDDMKDSICESAVTEEVFSGKEITPRGIIDLSENNAVINWTLKPSSIHMNANSLKTNSTEINVSIKANKSTSLTVYLMNSSGTTELASKTATVGTVLNTNFKFTNLTASETYRIQIKTHEQFESEISGKITD